MAFMSDRISKDDIMMRMTETISIMTEQISNIVETGGEWKEDPFIDMFSTIGDGVKDASIMSLNAKSTSDSLFDDLVKLITVFNKPVGEFPTVIRDRNIDLAISNTRVDRDSSNVHKQQHGLAFVVGEMQDATMNIQVGTAKFPFNPIGYSPNNNLRNDSAVVGIILTENNSDDGDGGQARRYRPVSRSTTSIFRRKRLHILLPAPNNRNSTSVRLPQPCPGSNLTGGMVLSQSRSEACGYAMIQFSVDGLETGRGTIRRTSLAALPIYEMTDSFQMIPVLL